MHIAMPFPGGILAMLVLLPMAGSCGLTNETIGLRFFDLPRPAGPQNISGAQLAFDASTFDRISCTRLHRRMSLSFC